MTRLFAPIMDGRYMTSAGDPSHFTIPEMTCKCGCGAHQMDQRQIDALERLRALVGGPLYVHSAVRCVPYNATRSGSAIHSQHLPRTPGGDVVSAPGTNDGASRATDLTTPELTPKQVQSLVRNKRALLGFHGLGCYRGFTHVDTRDIDGFAEWKG